MAKSAKRLAKLLSVAVLVVGLSIAVGAPVASAHAQTTLPGEARVSHPAGSAVIPYIGSCEWYFINQTGYTLTLTYGSAGYNLLFQISYYAEYNWATHAYCGPVYATTCLTLPANFNLGIIKIWDEYHYYDGGPGWPIMPEEQTNGDYQWVINPANANTTYCTNSPNYGLSANEWMGALTWAVEPDGVFTKQGWSQTAHVLGQF